MQAALVELDELEREMSLINQVLRDLDKRQAVAAGNAPSAAAVKSAKAVAPANALRRAARWGVGVGLTLTAIVVGGVAQGSISWPAGMSSKAQPVPVAAVAVALAAPQAVAPPLVATAVAEVRPVVVAEVKAPAPVAVKPVSIALATPTSRPTLVSTPRPLTTRPVPDAAASLVTALPRGEARIDKRMSTRTPQERAEAGYQRGVTAHQAGLIDESAKEFIAALREDPSFAPARLAQAGLLIGQSRLDDAFALLQEGHAMTPQQPALALMLARLQTERQDLPGAATTLQTALPRATNNAEYLGFYAAILQRASRHAEASEQFSIALRLAPANSVWWMGLGISLAAEGQTGAAREAFMRAKTTGALPPEAGQYVEARLRQML